MRWMAHTRNAWQALSSWYSCYEPCCAAVSGGLYTLNSGSAASSLVVAAAAETETETETSVESLLEGPRFGSGAVGERVGEGRAVDLCGSDIALWHTRLMWYSIDWASSARHSHLGISRAPSFIRFGSHCENL